MKQKKNIGLTMIKKTFTEEHKMNISIANKGQIPWNKGKTSKDDPRIKGHLVSESHKNKLSERMKINNPMFNKESRDKRHKNTDFKEAGRKAGITIKKQFENGRQSPLPKGSTMEEVFGKEKSDRIKEKQSKIRIEKRIAKGKNNPRYGIQSEFMKQKFKEKEFQERYCNAMNAKPNKPETLLIELLNNNFPNEWKYVGNYKFWIDGKNPDFMNVNGRKLLIELYGDYWHRNDNPQNRINYFKKFGFDCLVLWESEIRNNINIEKRIRNFNDSN